MRPPRLPGSLAACATAATLLALPAAAQAAPHGLLTGFTDGGAFQAASPADQAVAFQHARSAGATIVRLGIGWADVAPTKPPSLAVARDPSWSGYDWTDLDEQVRGTAAAGLRPLLQVNAAPTWAEGPNRPAVSVTAPRGSWKPSPTQLGAFAQALAKRYSGTFPDPLNPGQTLPRARYFQGWNEPNIAQFLSPQWKKVGGRTVPASPDLYRAMLNAWYRGVKAVSMSNVVVTGGTSPFGDYPAGGLRMPPAQFYRELFCLRGRKALKRFRCPSSPVHFDVLAHHPYPIGPPRRHAPNVDDVVIADFARLTRPLARALKDRTVAPRGRKQVWATELSWDTKPPDPDGIPTNLQATYVEGAFSTMWSEGVDAVVWFNLRDQAPDPDYASTLQSGIYLDGPTVAQDVKKPSFTAFSFPFTAYLRHGRAHLWGLAPAAGPVTIEQRRSNGSWKTIARLTARRDRLFLGSKRLRAGALLRARQGTTTSLTWKVFSPS